MLSSIFPQERAERERERERREREREREGERERDSGNSAGAELVAGYGPGFYCTSW
jgi:hypothetical protein